MEFTQAAEATAALLVDAQTSRVITALREEGVDPILLKGPSIRSWLYGDGTSRPYGDTDLLVDVSSLTKAEGVLAGLGYEGLRRNLGLTYHASPWVRADSGREVDLHTRMWGWGDDGTVWNALQTHRTRLRVGNVEASVLDEVALAVHVATHALQHDLISEKANRDLSRALEQGTDEMWADAAELATAIGAADSFAVALHSQQSGRDLCERIGIAEPNLGSVAIRLAAAGAMRSGAPTVETLLRAPGARARGRILVDLLFPSVLYARSVSSRARAEHGSRAAVYVRYWLRLIWRAPGAVKAWLAARASPRSELRRFSSRVMASRGEV